MSQKTNPTSLRLQKTSQNFAFPLFADFFWSECYRTCLESHDYIAAFLKKNNYSEAFFSPKMFYRKFYISIFVQDNRLAKKEKLLFFKKNIQRALADERRTRLLKKSKIDYTKFYLEIKKIKARENVSFITNSFLSKNVQSRNEELFFVKKSLRDDFLKIRQGFFKEITKKNLTESNNPIFEKDKKPLFYRKVYAVSTLLPQKSILHSPKIVSRPCLSFCEKTVSAKKQIKNIELQNALFTEHSLDLKKSKAFLESRLLNRSFIKSSEIKQPLFIAQKKEIGLKAQPLSSKKGEEIAKKYVLEKSLLSPNTRLTLESVQSKVEKERKDGLKLPFFPIASYIEPIRFIREDQNAVSLANLVVFLLEKRISFRQIKSLLFREALTIPQIKGIRISCSGRLGGRSKKAQKAKVQSDNYGRTALAAFSSKILFASKSAYTSYGKVGVKIWLSFEDIK